MTGPAHYAEAERMLAVYESEVRDAAAEWKPEHSELHRAQAALALGAAQAHATLALAAATAYRAVKDYEPSGAVDTDARAWAEVTSP